MTGMDLLSTAEQGLLKCADGMLEFGQCIRI